MERGAGRRTIGEPVYTPPNTEVGMRPKPKRTMGLWTPTALVVGNMIGSGVFLLPASLAVPASLAGTPGAVSILAWVFTGAGAILLALVVSGLGRAMPRTGGPALQDAAKLLDGRKGTNVEARRAVSG
jgi:hypothetical protein